MRSRRTGSTTPIEGPSDCYTVNYLEAGGIQVKHFPNADPSTKACCNVMVTITDADRAQAQEFELVKGATAALHRSYLAIEKKHSADEERGAA